MTFTDGYLDAEAAKLGITTEYLIALIAGDFPVFQYPVVAERESSSLRKASSSGPSCGTS
jgi:hypothetical protein